MDLSHRAVFRLAGRDPAGMLQAITTNEVPPEPGRGVYAALLTPKGRVRTDLRALKQEDDLLIVTEPEGRAAAQEILGRYAPFSRVQLSDLTGELGTLGVSGPGTTDLLPKLDLAEHETRSIQLGGATLLAVGVARPVPGYELLGPAEALEAAWGELLSLGAAPVGLLAHETIRITSGLPRFGADITEENFPGETGILDRAVNFQKGCYPGQETVARMHYRGHPNRTLHSFSTTGEVSVGDVISQDEKKVGELTSVAPLPVDGETRALGYLRRKADPEGELTAAASPLTLVQ